MTVSAAFLVKDPPVDRLVALIEMLRPIVQQFVIVVDNRTAAETVELMDSWGADVECVPYLWNDNFSDARNAALPHMTGDWVLCLDPDEMPTAAMVEFIRMVDASPWEDMRWQGTTYPAPRGYLFWFKNYFNGRQGAEWEEHWHCRLFRRFSGAWYKPVHEQVMLDGLGESRTRGTPYLPKAPRGAFVIHSRMEDDRDAVYVRIEQAMAGVGA